MEGTGKGTQNWSTYGQLDGNTLTFKHGGVTTTLTFARDGDELELNGEYRYRGGGGGAYEFTKD